MASIFAAAASCDGSALIERDTLLQLFGYAQANGYMVDAIEVYELSGDLEIPRVDLGLYGGELVHETRGMSYEQSMQHVREAVDFTIAAADALAASCGFLIWLAETRAWREATASTLHG